MTEYIKAPIRCQAIQLMDETKEDIKDELDFRGIQYETRRWDTAKPRILITGANHPIECRYRHWMLFFEDGHVEARHPVSFRREWNEVGAEAAPAEDAPAESFVAPTAAAPAA